MDCEHFIGVYRGKLISSDVLIKKEYPKVHYWEEYFLEDKLSKENLSEKYESFIKNIMKDEVNYFLYCPKCGKKLAD